MNLISSTFSGYCLTALNNLFDTFSRNITIYKTPNKTILTQDTNYNFAFPETQDITYTPVSGIFKARIKCDNEQKDQLGTKSSQEESLKLALNLGRIKLIVSGDGYEYLKDCQSVEVDGMNCIVDSDYRPKKQFGMNYYVFYIKRAQ
jgi:hypothetical protein